MQRPASGCSRKSCSIEGTKCATVIPSALDRGGQVRRVAVRRRAAPSPRGRPPSSGQKNSQTETSKENGVFCSTRLAGLRCRTRSCIHASRFTRLPVLDHHPLGRPVEPEV